MSACAVTGCRWTARHEGLCVPHALTWLLTKDSDKTPGREERLAAFIARQSARNFLGRGATIQEEDSP